ncbi:MAG: hypothetical protein ACT4QG_07815 [Sporichthyaceae bacterium]
MTEPGIVAKVLAIDEALATAGIVHAFGGALALAFHVAHPRATADIDVNVSAPTDAAEGVLAALPPGVAHTAADVARVQRDGQVRLWWGRTPVDLFFPQHLLHQVVAGRTVRMPLRDTSIPVLSATDLTVFKALFDRPKDWIDIASMLAHGGPNVAEAIAWLVEILGPDDERVARLRAARPDDGTHQPRWDELRRP